MTYTIVIPNWRPPLANEWVGRHWSCKHRLRRAMSDMIGAYARLANVPEATGKRRVALYVTMPRLCDADAMDKLFLDSLTCCRLIVNDAESGLDGRMKVELVRGGLQTVIVLEDV